MKEDFFSVNFLIALALIISIGLVGYNTFLMPDYGWPVVSQAPVAPSIPESSAPAVQESSSAEQQGSASSDANGKPKKDPYAVVNINTATEEELQTIIGIGPMLAGEILRYRDKVGVILEIGELMNVDGIGEATYIKIAPHFSLE